MKRLLFFILPISIIAAAVFVIFGLFQVKAEEASMMDELHRKARSVAESLAISAHYIFKDSDMPTAFKVVDAFQKRERLLGCAIYDLEGKVLAITERYADWAQNAPNFLKELAAKKIPYASIHKYKTTSVYTYIMPVLDDNQNCMGLIEVIYDTSYIYSRPGLIWKRVSITLLVLLLLLVLTYIAVQKRVFIDPVKQLTIWFHLFQKGETDEPPPIYAKSELGKLATEVEQVALNLRIARRVVTDNAADRIQQQEVWTETKLRDLIQAKLGDNALFVVSNREPYMHVTDELTGQTKCIRPAGGVVTALNPIMKACGGTWIAHGSTQADRKFVNSRNKLGVPPQDNRYILKRVWLTKEEEEGYYYGFSNEGLWPLCHITHVRPIFRQSDWEMYYQVNRKFADAVLEELPANKPFIFIQDYHFTLIAKMIKEKRPDATIALFWHIPWPNPEVFAICPYHQQILDGMLACDLIGFHVQFHCNNFLETANRLLESRIDTEKFTVNRGGKQTYVRPYPISVNGYSANQNDCSDRIKEIKDEFNLEGKIVGIGVERIDYTKGIKERILAIDRFLEKYPQYRRKFVFIQLAAPSRTHIKSYHDLMAEIDEIVDKKNWKYSEADWKPIIYLRKHFAPEDILPFFRLAQICIVSSLHDGMNLVAKEYVASKTDLNGVLILSNFTGASRELIEAVDINPYSIEEFADAIKQAVEMPVEERKLRMDKMQKTILNNNVYKWAGSIISDLTTIKPV